MIGLKATPELYALVLEALADITSEVTEVSIRASEPHAIGVDVVARIDQAYALRRISNRIVTHGSYPRGFVRVELDQLWADLRRHAGQQRPAPAPGAACGSPATALVIED